MHHCTDRRRRGPTPRRWRLALTVAMAATGLAGCGGGSHAPHVASLSTPTTDRSAQTVPTARNTRGGHPSHHRVTAKSNPTVLLDEWARCMRTHGDPGQAAPTIDANKVIHLTWNDATPGGIYGTNKGGQGNAGPGQYCRSYIDKAETDLQGSQHLQQPSQVQLVRFSQCMRANGVSDFPDPSNGGLSFNRGGDLNPSNPVFRHASTVCAEKVGVPGLVASSSPPPGSVEFNSDATGGAGG